MLAAFELMNVQCAGVTTVIQNYQPHDLTVLCMLWTAASVYGSIVEILRTKQQVSCNFMSRIFTSCILRVLLFHVRQFQSGIFISCDFVSVIFSAPHRPRRRQNWQNRQMQQWNPMRNRNSAATLCNSQKVRIRKSMRRDGPTCL